MEWGEWPWIEGGDHSVIRQNGLAANDYQFMTAARANAYVAVVKAAQQVREAMYSATMTAADIHATLNTPLAALTALDALEG